MSTTTMPKVEPATSWQPGPTLFSALSRFEKRLGELSHHGARYLTPEAAREALREIGEMVATVSLYLPVRDAELVDPVLEAIDATANNPEVCDV